VLERTGSGRMGGKILLENINNRRLIDFKTTGLHPFSTLKSTTKADLFNMKRHYLPYSTMDRFINRDGNTP
jgi:hypothetical protein